MSKICNRYDQGKHTIDINHQVASRVELVYDLVDPDLFGLITPDG